ncbi:Six-hairpin glycosidase-like protein [Microdochium bolleyi]|uniref:Six-hairpin glycosidase-like protein n=1 Tax=Microdochium bolleyi TaxID=196109 RepID=A0A136J8X7_9PEZI|nr:Six-hairpin glycosidase-like protein [Microdochium bolleyi]
MVLKDLSAATAAQSASTFATLASQSSPKLHRWTRKPQRIIAFEPCKDEFFGVRAVPATKNIANLPTLTWGKGDDFVLDFGLHMVGSLSFDLSSVGAHQDSPCRLRLTFGESPLDVTMGMEGVETWISTAWLPDEVINVDVCPQTVYMKRRYAFRYLRVEIIDTSTKFKVAFSNVACECISAVSQQTQFEALSFDGSGTTTNDSGLFQAIDQVSIMTLRDCMQTVFEDGPRRDRRIWIGDLRLQALVNYATLKDFNLVKRCLLMFAAVTREDGSMPACLFEKPALAAASDYLLEYDALFAATVCDYVAASGDLDTGRMLWPTVLACLRTPLTYVDPETMTFDSRRGDDWQFLDWAPGVNGSTGSHGLVLYCLKAADKLARMLQVHSPYTHWITGMTAAAPALISDDGVVVSGPEKQVSYACASWLVLSEALPQDVARAALLKTLADTKAIKPLTPYAWHHVCDALLVVGCEDECLDLLRTYWGGMIRAGADTFWEAYDPEDPKASPYGDVRNNSFCHAWSCTPSLLLRTRLLERVGGKVAGPMTMGALDDAWVRRSVGAPAQL